MKMNDLISRQDAIDAIDTLLIQLHERHTNEAKGSFEDGVQDGYCRIRSCIKWMPSAERKGHWEYLYDGNYKCSNCGSWWAMEDEPCEEGLNFCPNCGVDMRGEEDGM